MLKSVMNGEKFMLYALRDTQEPTCNSFSSRTCHLRNWEGPVVVHDTGNQCAQMGFSTNAGATDDDDDDDAADAAAAAVDSGGATL